MTFPERTRASDLEIIKNSNVYILPVGWALAEAGSYDFRLQLTDKSFAHGSTSYGDGKVKGRTIQVEFDMQGSTEEEHDAMVNLAYQKFAQTDYTLRCGRSDRVFKVAGISKLKQSYEKGYKQRLSNITVSLLLADPFRYAASQTVVTKNYAANQTDAEITFNNPSSVDVPLIWTFTPPAGGTVPSIAITHVESGQSFTLKDTLLTNPAVAVVNAETGTVRRDTGNSLNTFAGIFLHALPGSNTFKYTGAACKVDIAFTTRWFV
ncbi:MAG: phage tail protein [Acidaminococcaceae bacterium]